MNSRKYQWIGLLLALVGLALLATWNSARAVVLEQEPEELVCEEGYHVESVLVSEAVPEVEEVSHIEYHEEVTEEVTENVCTNVGYIHGIYKDSECTKLSIVGSKYKFVEETKTVVVEEAYEEVVVDVPYSPAIPAVYEDVCVQDEVVEEPAPPILSGGRGACLNCDRPKKEEVEEETSSTQEDAPEVEEVETVLPLPEAPSCPQIKGFIAYGADNDPEDVKLLQGFFGLPLTGVYDEPSLYAVYDFQATYYDDVISPWVEILGDEYANTTGWVYVTTRWKLNSLLCPNEQHPFPTLIGM